MAQQPYNKRPAGLKIEPFRHPIAMDPHYADKTWQILADAIQEIFNQNASGLSFEELYRNAYNMVLHKFGERLYNGLIASLTKQLTAVAEKVEACQGVQFLKELKKRWEEHNKATQMIRDILMYMDRTFVAQQQKTAVYQLGLDLWRDVVIRNRTIRERLLTILLDLIAKERSGELVERQLIKSTTVMLVDLGLPVYVEELEQHLLRASADFYQKEAQEFISSSDCPEYLRKASKRLDEEVERVKSYLDPTSEPKLVEVVEKQLIANQVKALAEMENSGLIALLRDDKYDDLERMYCLFRRVDGALTTMKNMLSEYVKEMGRQLVQDPEKTRDPVEFVQRLLDARDKYERIIVQSFHDDKSFRNVLNQAFEHFINLQQRSPEYISLFIDDMLRKGLKGITENEVEGVLDKVMALFRYLQEKGWGLEKEYEKYFFVVSRYLQEKDVFEKYYKQHLAKRLLSGRTVSDDAERNLLVKLKTECGYQFTSKLESMFNDIKTSRDTMQDFKAKMVEGGVDLGIDLAVQVLTTGSWPTQSNAKCNLPRELERSCEEFKKFYLAAHSGRRLTWQTNMGTADLKACFASRRHEVNVSTYQMCILLLFNDSDSLRYDEIAAATDIPSGDLKRSLQSLACVKGKNVLRKEPMSKDINETDAFFFNDGFQSKLYKLKISTVAAQKEAESEKAETRHKVEEDRKPQIEAAIVRIMKARRVLDHNSVISEVTRQLSPRFVPNPAVIKKRIESLIEREFLERDPDDRRLYRYLA